MKRVFWRNDNRWLEVTGQNPNLFSIDGEERAPLIALLTLSPERQESFGVFVCEDDPVPQGYTVLSEKIEGDERPTINRTLEAKPASVRMITRYQILRRIEALAGPTQAAQIRAFILANDPVGYDRLGDIGEIPINDARLLMGLEAIASRFPDVTAAAVLEPDPIP